MTIHAIHPDSHEQGLADDCERCAELAEDPVNGLDAENLTRIIRLAVDRSTYPLTQNDAVAAAKVLTMLEQVGHIYRTQPALVQEFLFRYLPVLA